MGWRDREYARWTGEERRRFLGSSAGAGTARSGPTVGGGVALAAAISLAVLALGNYPRADPVLPGLRVGAATTTPATAVGAPIVVTHAPTVTLGGPSVVPAHSFLTFHGQVPEGDRGVVRILGSFDGGRWRTLAVADGSSGRYTARIALDERGTLRIRVVFRDGAKAVKTLRIR